MSTKLIIAETKKLSKILFIISILSTVSTGMRAQENYKHPHLNASGHVLNEQGEKLGWVTKEGIIHNAKGEKVAFIKGSDVVDKDGKKLGHMDKNGTYYDSKGEIVFTVEPNSKGEQCKIFDKDGKFVATAHESYKNQACAIHCLGKKMPMH